MNRLQILFVIFTFYEKRESNPLGHIKIQICLTENKSSLNT